MRFRHKNSLVRHQCQHTGERRYQCQLCDYACIALHRLTEHLKRSHPEDNSEETNIAKSEEAEKLLAVDSITKETAREDVQIVSEVRNNDSKKPPPPPPVVMSVPIVPALMPVMSADGMVSYYLLPSQAAFLQQQQNSQGNLPTLLFGSPPSQQTLTVCNNALLFPPQSARNLPQQKRETKERNTQHVLTLESQPKDQPIRRNEEQQIGLTQQHQLLRPAAKNAQEDIVASALLASDVLL